ncbi:hypothetical protein [Wenxinia marina]|nr:hypothetical protein [Wenxinia marina]GGL69455.1 hypothetical protein GCM10011392_24900 [Wenxinia marina]
MSDGGRREMRGWVFKTIVIVAFVFGLSFVGAAWAVHSERNCMVVPGLTRCAEARIVMVAGGVIAIGAVVALWLRAARRRHS